MTILEQIKALLAGAEESAVEPVGAVDAAAAAPPPPAVTPPSAPPVAQNSPSVAVPVVEAPAASVAAPSPSVEDVNARLAKLEEAAKVRQQRPEGAPAPVNSTAREMPKRGDVHSLTTRLGQELADHDPSKPLDIHWQNPKSWGR